ncbi:MAG: imidazolonepropionase [Bacillota bacterium]|nr:imidazolonepropionase [Bacillota bacterium]MDP4114366.1 imidazolonepropionase [Bacillota bacterium]
MPREKGKQNTPQSTIDEIMRMHNQDGVSIRELSSIYKMPFKSVKNMVTRENNKKRRVKAGIEPCRRGRPKKGHVLTENEKDNEIRRLKMENELLRDFLHAVGRK